MFENPQQPPTQSPPPPMPSQSPLNPVMPAPGMSTMGTMPPSQPAPAAAPQPQVHAMPERFRATGGGSGGSKGTKGLVIALVVVVVVAGLAAAGLYVFNNVLSKNNGNIANTVVVNNTDTTNTTNENTNTALDNTNTLNTNVDVNTNSLTNESTNLNTNTPLNTNTTNTNTSIPTGPLPSSTDSDNDGLTDVEEVAYGTDVNNPDSDADGFVDGKQVKADGSIAGEVDLGYNPKGTGSLEASSIVKRVTNGPKNYSILVPAAWTVTTDSSGGLLVTPSTTTSEFFKVGIIDNPTRLAPKDWYQQTNPSADPTSLKQVTMNGLEGVVSEDASTVYLVKDDKIYSIQYGTGSLSQVNYWVTFDMIQRSFKLGS